ncbi:hypothetical protein SARC_03180 [Sphaeroforma arctica JP610]|uniref:Importin N-terminal domain-containing protein n=1 Tax=Sphaeroforma arctica JP610 TaxID=667725 RepID=A0A0L0G8R1_9EUKA|nr:hypothetical protein SARC_03180 [Sphaeroforma arctica JP610]KNC84613.1 hypothetical protein SARC_03180 [Sphaeroforma arctica JP610]|eukprot:XP_014158515.1 hypothetical protein SARC_03180 [Sphaeroforma arctica JP610]
MAASIANLKLQLQNTLSPDQNVRVVAEQTIEQASKSQNYSLLLLKIVSEDTHELHLRVAAAVTFKNFIKKNWEIDGQVNKIADQDRLTIKTHIVDLMLKMPSQLQAQLSEAVSLIGKHDFPDAWPELLPSLVAKLDNNDVSVINGVLRTASSLFNRYTYEFKSDELWTEINIALKQFAQPLTDITAKMISILPQNASNRDTLTTVFSLLHSALDIFYSLNYQDLPEFFEDNMDQWMLIHHTLLVYDNPLVRSDSDDRPGPLEKTMAKACDNVALYAGKYDEEDVPFRKHLPVFVEDIWNLLCTTSGEIKNDYLVSGGLAFLSAVAKRPGTSSMFGDPATLKTICEKIVIPNMQLRESDVEAFEDDPQEYIGQDIEGSDTETRRRAACDLVKALRQHFEQQVTAIFSSYVEVMLAEYAKDPVNNWKSKDAAIYLVTSLSVTSTLARAGATKVNEFIPLLDFYKNTIIDELRIQNIDERPVIKSDCVKYVTTFRNQLGKQVLIEALPLLVAHILSSSVVLSSYAANGVERLLMMKEVSPTGVSQAVITRQDIKPFLSQAINNVFAAIAKGGQASLNPYLMKTTMRLINVGKEDIFPYLESIMDRLIKKLEEVSANPTKPDFNHYLFESISAAVRFCCNSTDPSLVVAFETYLLPRFVVILQKEVLEFLPYVFQIMSQLLELNLGALPATYTDMFPHLMAPVLWEKSGNVPGLSKFIQTYISKMGATLSTDTRTIESLLGIFQKLLASKSNDHFGFAILNAIVTHVPVEGYQQHVRQIYNLIFSRLQAAKSPKLVSCIIVNSTLMMGLHGPDLVINAIDSIQPKLFNMVITSLYLPSMQKLQTSHNRKICAVGFIRLLTECPAMITTYKSSFASLLTALLKLFELPKEKKDDDDIEEVSFTHASEFATVHTQLSFAKKPEVDPFAAVVDARIHLAKALHTMSTKMPGKVPALLQGLDPQVQGILSSYLTQAQVQLA